MHICIISAGTLKSKKEATRITLINFSKKLIKAGNKVIILCEYRNDLKKYEVIDSVPLYRIAKLKEKRKKYELLSIFIRIFSFPINIKKVENHANIDFDIIHGFSASPLLVLRTIFCRKKLGKIKTIHTIKSYSKYRGSYLFSRLLNHVDIVTAPTNNMLKRLVKYGVKKEKIRIIPSFIDLNKFFPKNKEKLKKKYGFKGKKIVLYYGLMHERKGVGYLINAIPDVLKKEKNIVFVFAPRNIKEGYINQIKRLGVESNVKIIKGDIKIEDYVNLADMVVLPYSTMSSTEANPSCLLEAMACKTPIISSKLAEIKELIKDGENGLLVKPKDSASITIKILKLLNDPKLSKKLAENAFKDIKKYDINKVTKEYLKIYKKLVRNLS